MLTLYTDIKITESYKDKININIKGNTYESQTCVNGSFDKLNYFKSDAIQLHITNYTNESTLIIDEINSKLHQTETIFEYRSSCIKCTKKINQFANLMKKIDKYNNILNLELPVYHKELCTSEESICYQITINDNFEAKHTNVFVIEYIGDINNTYLNPRIYEQEELENIQNYIPTPLEFINLNEFNTEGELL
jgi:hypothetical protein